MSSNVSEEDKASHTAKRVSKVLDSHLEHDKEALVALKELSNFFTENNIQSRRNLRSKIEKRSLEINEDFLSAFRKVKESLDRIYSDVVDMNTAVQNMTSQLNATKAETHHLLEQTAKLQSENSKICMQEEIAEAFLRSFQLSKSELTALREANITEDFFSSLERVQTIHTNCRNLMQCGYQTSALDIMDQMAAYQETALEKLYRWAQTQCKNIESPALSQLLTKAMSKLQDRPVLYKYVMTEYCTHRRSVLVRIFLDALTKGGPGGTPSPIEMNAHDPQRYISDMLAFLHQAIPSEHENLVVLLKGSDKMDITEAIQEALANISEGVCTPLKVRVEQIITSDTLLIKTLYSITNLLCFYHQTFIQEIGETGGLVTGLKDLYDQSGESLMSRLGEVVKKEIVETVSIPPRDLSPSPGVEMLLGLLRDLLSVAPVADSHNQYPTKIVGCILDPLLQAVNVSASRLATTDMAVYLLNCLHLMQTTLAFYDFIDERLERLQAQCDAQLDTLTSEQASSLVANLNLGPIYTLLQEQGKSPLSNIPGLQPTILSNFLRKFDSFISMPELLILPQVGSLLSGKHRSMVQHRSIEVIVAIYRQLYNCVNDANNGYENAEQLMPRTPKQVSELLLGIHQEDS